jgi:Protein of unknown function (DUF664)
MSWTAPEVTRSDPPLVADERTALEGWLTFHRETLLMKCAGLTSDQLRERAAPPSTMSLLGLVRHMTEVERWWFRRHVAGEDVRCLYWSDAHPDGDFDFVDDADPEADLNALAREIELARQAAAGRPLDDVFVDPHWKVEKDIRWVYIHMIEEYARHNGHADLLRERIDGVTGD